MAQAKKFNNGENLGTVRQILNDNADAINQRVEKEEGKGLSSNDYTLPDKQKLNGIAPNATANDTDANLKNRLNHTGTQSADTITDGTTNKAYTATEKTKLGGVATGATKNATDAQLRDRTTHTGSQTVSTVTGLQAALDARPPLASDSPIKYNDIWACSQAQYDASSKLSTRRYDIFE